MAHAEKCPICYGKGRITESEKTGFNSDGIDLVKCHGCNGCGWVTVRD